MVVDEPRRGIIRAVKEHQGRRDKAKELDGKTGDG